jgi:hypothetical protein
MSKLLSGLALIGALGVGSAWATDLGISVSVGEPGFYGQLQLGNIGRPPVIYSQPVVVEHRYPNLAPVYLRVPPGHAKNWNKYCDRYNACTRPVYFVNDDWYRNVYVPHYQESKARSYAESDRQEGHDRHEDHENHKNDHEKKDKHDDRQ